MPEGPEIRRAADEIAAVLQGEKIEKAWFGLPRLRRFVSKLEGSTVLAVDTRGKAMLTRFDNGLTLYSHNQLYGRWIVSNTQDEPVSGRSLRVALHTVAGSAWLFSASDIEVLTETGLSMHPFLLRIGPDVLDESLDATSLAARLDLPAYRNRSLAALYLDQGFLAGIGNYLRSEILFSARLHAALRPSDIDAPERRRLARESLALARRSYRTHGITLPATRARELKRQGLERRARRFWVFGRDGQPCYRCGTTIIRMDAGSRGLFLCASCQPLER